MENKMVTDICEVKDYLASVLKTYVIGCNIEDICAKEVGEVADVIKDLAETHYYCTVTKAMEEGGEYPEDMYGYSPRMTRNNMTHGRMGYIPYMDGDWDYDPRMGYNGSGSSSRTVRGTYNGNGMNRSGYKPMVDQEPYVMDYLSQYRDAKRHFNETHSSSDKKKMDEKAEESFDNVIDILKEIWEGADPTLQRNMKSDLTELMSHM